MHRILLINPNSSAKTTAMMVEIARASAGNGIDIVGITAARAPPMIVSEAALMAAADEVIEIGVANSAMYSGVIVGAFGDPGLATLRQGVTIPVTGICEAAMLEAAANGRRFGVATTTPDLVAAIEQRAIVLGLRKSFVGVRVTSYDPMTLAADPELQLKSLAAAVAQSLELDGAETVIIGGGPLGGAASELSLKFGKVIVAPIPAAVARLTTLIRGG